MSNNKSIELRGVRFEDHYVYKKPSMVLKMPWCNFTCNEECGYVVCDAYDLMDVPLIHPVMENLIYNYCNNPITQAVVFSGLEPFYRTIDYLEDYVVYMPSSIDSFSEMMNFIKILREDYKCDDDVVIYTGYTEEECVQLGFIDKLKKYSTDGNIIIKFGRYIHDKPKCVDPVLGVILSSDNQYAKAI